MALNQQTGELVARIEYMIGKQCYNPNSYDGYRDEYGRSFRYPVNFRISEDKGDIKTSSQVPGGYAESVTPEIVKSMKYKFGSNHLYIGDAIVEVLEMLEKRYSIDINQLEAQYRESKKKG